MATRLALVDDDQNILTSVALALENEGYEIDTYFDGEQALAGLMRRPAALAILDIKMPRMDGTELLGKIRQKSAMPVIFLTSKDDELDEALGLGMGADDYIIKPFDLAEVVARIRARLRQDRTGAHTGTSAYFSTWVAHFDRYSLEDENGLETPFSHAESEVLRMFLQSPKRLISRAQMQETLGGGASESFDRAMDVRISRLRTKLREDPKNPQLIKTIYGAGYIFLSDVKWVTQSPKPA